MMVKKRIPGSSPRTVIIRRQTNVICAWRFISKSSKKLLFFLSSSQTATTPGRQSRGRTNEAFTTRVAPFPTLTVGSNHDICSFQSTKKNPPGSKHCLTDDLIFAIEIGEEMQRTSTPRWGVLNRHPPFVWPLFYRKSYIHFIENRSQNFVHLISGCSLGQFG